MFSINHEGGLHTVVMTTRTLPPIKLFSDREERVAEAYRAGVIEGVSIFLEYLRIDIETLPALLSTPN